MGTSYVSDSDADQPVPILLKIGANAIFDRGVVLVKTPKYLVKGPFCDCFWQIKNKITTEKGLVKIEQRGMGSPFSNFIGASFDAAGNLICLGPVSEDLRVMSCADRNRKIIETQNFSVLRCEALG